MGHCAGGDIAKTLCVLEQITGVLFLTIMIARLAGIYLPAAGGPA